MQRQFLHSREIQRKQKNKKYMSTDDKKTNSDNTFTKQKCDLAKTKFKYQKTSKFS